MQRYRVGDVLGDGAYGVVMKAVVIASSETVAIKKMKRKFYNWQECMQLREIKSLKRLNSGSTCINIVKLKEVVRENDELFFVFEYAEGNLYKMIEKLEKGVQLPEASICLVMRQVFNGLAFIHRHGFFHRDLKPENLLVNNGDALTSPDEDRPLIVKLADFGLAREIRSQVGTYTEYVSTRWYRAPEVLLRSPNYNSPIDLWAAGIIMAEMFLCRPLFPGASEADELYKISTVLGPPTTEGPQKWPDADQLARASGYKFPSHIAPTSLRELITPAPPERPLKLMNNLLLWNPSKRMTAQDAHDYVCGREISRPIV